MLKTHWGEDWAFHLLTFSCSVFCKLYLPQYVEQSSNKSVPEKEKIRIDQATKAIDILLTDTFRLTSLILAVDQWPLSGERRRHNHWIKELQGYFDFQAVQMPCLPWYTGRGEVAALYIP